MYKRVGERERERETQRCAAPTVSQPPGPRPYGGTSATAQSSFIVVVFVESNEDKIQSGPLEGGAQEPEENTLASYPLPALLECPLTPDQ